MLPLSRKTITSISARFVGGKFNSQKRERGGGSLLGGCRFISVFLLIQLIASLLPKSIDCCDLQYLSDNGKEISIEMRVEHAQVVFRGLATGVSVTRTEKQQEKKAHNSNVLKNSPDYKIYYDGTPIIHRYQNDESKTSESRQFDRKTIYQNLDYKNGDADVGHVANTQQQKDSNDNSHTSGTNIHSGNRAHLNAVNGVYKSNSNRDSRINSNPNEALYLRSVAGGDTGQQRPDSGASAPASSSSSNVDDVRGVFTAYFELINTYKGAAALSVWDSSRYSRVSVTFTAPRSECLSNGGSSGGGTDGVPREYIVFCELHGAELKVTSAVYWTEESEHRVWNALGWAEWTDWSACSVTCDSGIQQRSRLCLSPKHDCLGPNIEQRLCNLFSCSVAVNPLALEDRRFFHPSRSQWARVPERPDAWRLQPNAYIWVPVSQVFPTRATTGVESSDIEAKSQYGTFPKEFTVFVTLRLETDARMGTLFSLRSRRQQDAYLSLELAGPSGVNLVHAGPNGTDIVRIPAKLGDGRWHRLAIGIRDDSTVNTFVDCNWLRTDILKKDALDTPEDADLIIGYLFTGDLEQLVIVSNAEAVSQQCSSDTTPIEDSSLELRQQPHRTIVAKKAPQLPSTTTLPTFVTKTEPIIADNEDDVTTEAIVTTRRPRGHHRGRGGRRRLKKNNMKVALRYNIRKEIDEKN